MNLSPAETALDPPGVVTTTSTVPVPAGLTAVMVVALITVRFVAAAPPKLTLVAPVKLVPVMVTTAPPAAGPEAGEMLVTVGADAMFSVSAAEVEPK